MRPDEALEALDVGMDSVMVAVAHPLSASCTRAIWYMVYGIWYMVYGCGYGVGMVWVWCGYGVGMGWHGMA